MSVREAIKVILGPNFPKPTPMPKARWYTQLDDSMDKDEVLERITKALSDWRHLMFVLEDIDAAVRYVVLLANADGTFRVDLHDSGGPSLVVAGTASSTEVPNLEEALELVGEPIRDLVDWHLGEMSAVLETLEAYGFTVW